MLLEKQNAGFTDQSILLSHPSWWWVSFRSGKRSGLHDIPYGVFSSRTGRWRNSSRWQRRLQQKYKVVILQLITWSYCRNDTQSCTRI